MTVLELVKKYIAQKTGVRHNTAANYNFVINIIKKEEFGALRIDKVKLSDAKAWLIKLQADGRGYSTMHSVRGVVRPAFQMAVDDDDTIPAVLKEQRRKVSVIDGILQEDVLFSSPSYAAMFVIGKSANGLTSWKDENGRSLKNIENSETD